MPVLKRFILGIQIIDSFVVAANRVCKQSIIGVRLVHWKNLLANVI